MEPSAVPPAPALDAPSRGVDALVAVVAAVHLATMLVLSIPRPHLDADELDRPETRAFVQDTTTALRGLGVPVERSDVADVVATAGPAFMAARSVVATPAATYASWTGAQQGWTMFAHVPDRSAVLVVEARQEGVWQEVFRSRDDVATWRRPFFDHARGRTFVNNFTWHRDRAGYRRLVGWLAPALAVEVPAEAWRVSLQTVTFPPPDVLARTGTLARGDRFWETTLPEGAQLPGDDAAEPDDAEPDDAEALP